MAKKPWVDVERALKDETRRFLEGLREIFEDYDGPVAGIASVEGDSRIGGFMVGVGVGLIGDDLPPERIHAMIDNVLLEERRKKSEERPS